MSLPTESPRHKLIRCLGECEEYLRRIGETENAATMEAAAGALWDVIMDGPDYRSPNGPAPIEYPAEAYMISRDLAESLARGDCRKVGG